MHGECVEPVVTAPTPAHMYCIKHLKQSRMLVRMPFTSVPSKLPSLLGLNCVLYTSLYHYDLRCKNSQKGPVYTLDAYICRIAEV